jgi:SAM-dependent methyltransferase
MSIDVKERETLDRFIERNVDVAPRDLDEGIGTVYERVVIDDYFWQLQNERNICTILENPADGVTGVPGINSLVFARHGGRVWLANPSQRLLDGARAVWARQGLLNSATFTCCPIDETPYKDDSFDLVWNFCMFERFCNPSSLITEMKRVSGHYVLIMTQNFYNFGTVFHKIYHKNKKLEWDHGYDQQMTIHAIRTAILEHGLHIEQEGTVDIPPWLDTWDMPLRGELKKLLALTGKKWEWKIKTQNQSTNVTLPWPIAFVRWIEANLPEWFRRFQAHHLFILARK